MKLAILHLSDLHIKSPSNVDWIEKSRQVSAALFPVARSADGSLILVTGDIAFSGSVDEFKTARLFLNGIREALENEGCPIVDVLCVPGNHDCQLRPESSVRSVVIEKIITEPHLAEDAGFVDTCVEVQRNYFEFRAELTRTAARRDDPLWTEYELLLDGKVIRVSAINASWMSRIPESPGQLIFPTHKFHQWLSEPAEIRLAMVHHPLNWYSQSSYHALRSALRTNCSAVFSGHEHVDSSGEVAEFGFKRQFFFESMALQPHDVKEKAGFSVVYVDTDNDLVSQQPFYIQGNTITHGQETKSNLGGFCSRDLTCLGITREFDQFLRDPGGGFGHPDKEHLEIDDLFVFPELVIVERENDATSDYSVSSEEVLFDSDKNRRVLLLGEEKVGKTALLVRSFKEFHSRGLVPILIQTDAIGSFSSSEILTAIRKATSAQYENPQQAEQAPKAKRICLLDDIDHARGGSRGLAKLIEELESQFSIVVATASVGFEIRELVNADAAQALEAYDKYQVARFGNERRHRLIRKWCQLGTCTSLPELDREVHALEVVVNGVVSRNLTPSLPIYLLILLQSCSQNQQAELQNSGFAHYYEYLMTRSLTRSGLRKDEYDELFNYLSQLAWLFREGDKSELTIQELTAFSKAYSEQFFTVDLGGRLRLLTSARLLARRGDCYSFAYPYVYYFFLGRYLAKNLSSPELKEKVRGWCQKLYLRKNALAVVFLSYHSNDEWIIDQVLEILNSCFPEVRPIEYGSDIAAVNGLVEHTARLVVEESNVDENQVEERRRRDADEKADKDEEESGNLSDGGALALAKVNTLFKAAEILGQITKNYYGSLARKRKKELLSRIISAPLRLVRIVLETVAEDPEALVLEMERVISMRQNHLDQTKRRELARNVAFHLLGFVCTNATIQTAAWIGNDHLEEDIGSTVESNPTVAFRLVEAGTRLLLPRDLALDKIGKLAKDLERNPFAFKILQSMGFRYLHLFHTKIQDRQRLCADLRIDIAATKTLEAKTKKTRLIE